ncbi:hypothetical protein EYR38_005119 [Pleurotus pulmonarius]|nr:hypothetical protein EYR38_005119 [Pleurotus pulmonarius]
MADSTVVINTQVLLGMKTSTYFSVASATFLTYDYLLMFPTEVRYVWQVQWGIGKVLYLLSRYPLLLASLVDLHRMTSHVASEAECHVLYSLVYLILIIRVWALWQRKLWVVFVLGSTLIAGTIIAAILAERTLRGVAVISDYMVVSLSYPSCLNASKDRKKTVVVYMIIMVNGTAAFLFMVIDGIRSRRYLHHGLSRSSSMMYIFYKDGRSLVDIVIVLAKADALPPVQASYTLQLCLGTNVASFRAVDTNAPKPTT